MSILCKIGLHKASKTNYVRVRIVKSRPCMTNHTYYKNYQMCERCGKRLHRVYFRKEKV